MVTDERDEVKVVNDQRGSPTWAKDLSRTIVSLILAENGNEQFGIYHYTNEGNITWFEFAKEIYRQGKNCGLIKKECMVSPCTSAEYPSKVTRPSYSVLDKGKVKKTLGINIPLWNESLAVYLKSMRSLTLQDKV